MLKNKNETLTNILFNLPIFVMACLSFNTQNGNHFVSKLIIILSISSIFHFKENIKENLKSETTKRTFYFLTTIATILSLYTIIRGESFSMPRVIYLSALYIVSTPWERININFLTNTIISGGVACGVLSFYERFYLNIDRVGGVINQIPFATYAGITLIITFSVYNRTQTKITHIFYTSSIIGSICAIILSETRGVWLALISIAFIYLSLMLIRKATFKKIGSYTLLSIFILTIALSLNTVQQRIKETKYEISAIQSGNLDSSWGIRVQLWKSAIDIIKSNPIIGVGTLGWKESIEQKVKNKELTNNIKIDRFSNSHVHNQYLDSYVRFGILGPIIVILFITLPIFTYKNMNNYCLKLYLPAFLFITGLSDVPSFHTGLIYMISIYPFIIANNQLAQLKKHTSII